MSETDVDTLRLEKGFGKEIVRVQSGAPQVGEISTPFQN